MRTLREGYIPPSYLSSLTPACPIGASICPSAFGSPLGNGTPIAFLVPTRSPQQAHFYEFQSCWRLVMLRLKVQYVQSLSRSAERVEESTQHVRPLFSTTHLYDMTDCGEYLIHRAQVQHSSCEAIYIQPNYRSQTRPIV